MLGASAGVGRLRNAKPSGAIRNAAPTFPFPNPQLMSVDLASGAGNFVIQPATNITFDQVLDIPSGVRATFYLRVIGNGGAIVWTWGANFRGPTGVTYTPTSTLNKWDLLGFACDDGVLISWWIIGQGYGP